MRHLVDLDSKIAIITWHERAHFPGNEMELYRELARKKHQWHQKLTDEEENKLNILLVAPGKLKPHVEKVEISELLPQSRNKISTTHSLTGYEWNKISKEIAELDKQIETPDITVEEVYTSEDTW